VNVVGSYLVRVGSRFTYALVAMLLGILVTLEILRGRRATQRAKE
jgi:hypothetical protein